MQVTSIVEGDYEHAIVQLICLLYEEKYHLVFASAELWPAELERPPQEKRLSEPAKRLGGNGRIFYSRYVLTAREAMAWYERCREGKFELLQRDASYPAVAEPHLEEPPWPQLVVGTKFPVSGDVPSSVRAHHLYPEHVPPLIQKLFDLHPELRTWASDRILTSFERYPELAGSIHLLVPNPVFRSLHMRLHIAEDGSEGTAIEITPREGMTSEGLQATVIEHRPTGISAYQTMAFAAAPYLLVKHVGAVEEVELYLHCPRRGLLEWQAPSSYMRQSSIGISLISSRKRIQVPQPPGTPPEEYEVPLSHLVSTSTHREPGGPTVLPAILRKREFERKRSDEAERLGQKWFHRSKTEATEFVRALIGTARERVWIVDPYFAAPELFSFALATTHASAKVVILTGASTAMQIPDLVDSTIEAGEQLLRTLSRTEMGHIEVKVMTGDMPTVHDRFLVIDNAVWFTGNSLNSLGERAGMMISVPAPDVVVAELQNILDDLVRTRTLADWVAARKTNKTT
ncbi:MULTISPECIES: VPA1262 family N-terminal domain-containing protein [unclassified Herbaspirillum]|uniref:VPA1262 family N-terminal domain-containing protein n=1 Tax=unclassified Herbaspirillum TaxID=2624150 RepID=UPI000E2F1765|nr:MULTISPECIES: VPA1262 family N-terminal domain-containing protein [unclassified Herbaspirillum]RFB68598.1 hypothetical protein DZB54_15760 [Herbaspirillum sp. 3R-3a1]TFI05504.1 hypothetical protein E4P32_20435 [Herbaspirillum sp. 3R11]TFI13586.1 hypothetical protein E4P31_18160 [Herbaspirillum sp. 3R-11]TFI27108.1 hypothetical protein E4P30_10510 [Herbaspirillum sp. 3C11]